MPRYAATATLAIEMTDDEAPARICRLDEFNGQLVVCPEEKCAFWEPGGAVLEGRCVLDGIDFAHEPGLATWLIEFRDAVARGAPE
jgi:hypothetical protein